MADRKDLPLYQMIADEKELKWFFDHVIQRPQVNESYSMVFVSRHKKLTKEEQETIGLTRAESEFLATQAIKLRSIKNSSEENNEFRWTFEEFLKHIRRFNVDKYAYTTALGEPIPSKTLAIIFYINPADDMTVADNMINQLLEVKTAISKAMLGGKTTTDNIQSFQVFGNIESNVKHLKAQCKGTSYWIDYDLDVPAWFKENTMGEFGNGKAINFFSEIKTWEDWTRELSKIKGQVFFTNATYMEGLRALLNLYFGKGNYIIVDTSGGFHILVRTTAIKSNPHQFCLDIKALYETGIVNGNPAYIDEKGQCKFECILNGSHQTYNPEAEKEAKEAVEHLQDLQAQGLITQREFKILRRSLYDSLKTKDNKTSIPGIPLPGTYQYDRPVTVLNKEDFD